MGRRKTVDYEEVAVYLVTWEEWVPPEAPDRSAFYEGEWTSGHSGYFQKNMRRFLDRKKKDAFVRGLRRHFYPTNMSEAQLRRLGVTAGRRNIETARRLVWRKVKTTPVVQSTARYGRAR